MFKDVLKFVESRLTSQSPEHNLQLLNFAFNLGQILLGLFQFPLTNMKSFLIQTGIRRGIDGKVKHWKLSLHFNGINNIFHDVVQSLPFQHNSATEVGKVDFIETTRTSALIGD
jgi:hypothetical protein